MNKEELIKKSTRLMNKTKIKMIKHSPEIFMVAGIIGTIGSTILACKATTKVSKILEEKDGTVFNINRCYNNPDAEYDEHDKNKDLTIVYTQTGLKIAKLYMPSIVLGTVSIASIINGHNILKKRNIALAAAYTVVDKGFKDYRKNVVERFGEEIDKELRYNIKKQEIETTIVDKKGKEKINKEVINVVGDSTRLYSDYAKIFDCGSEYHQKDPEYNLMFLRRQQEYANEMLKSRGYLFLNEVYEMLGFQKTKAGQIVGWIYDEKNPIGDNYVDFNIYNINNERNAAFINGYEYNIILDFNVDGNILDLI